MYYVFLNLFSYIFSFFFKKIADFDPFADFMTTDE